MFEFTSTDTLKHCIPRETSYPLGTAQNEHNNKPMAVPRDRINDILWRGSKFLGVLLVSNT